MQLRIVTPPPIIISDIVDLQDMSNSLGDYASYLPMLHAITDCDTTSYYHFRHC